MSVTQNFIDSGNFQGGVEDLLELGNDGEDSGFAKFRTGQAPPCR